MKNLFAILLTFSIIISCKNDNSERNVSTSKTEFEEIIKADYELSKPENTKEVLVLFGGYPEKAEDIKRDFKILEIAKKNNIAVLFMNYNQKLWLEENEKQKLAEQLQNIFLENKIPTDNIFIGGFSSGGNIALLISSFLIASQEFKTIPKGVFIVDSPVDLMELYKSVQKNVERNFSKPSVQEGTWLIETLAQNFGDPKSNLSKYEQHSVFTLSTSGINNLISLKNTKIRLYTEPDTLWWKENRMVDYYQTNAYLIKRLSETLEKSNFKKVEYISTKNRGYRASGERHPHSWAIVDEKELIKWITE